MYLCNRCREECFFAPKKRVEGDVEIVYLECPHCGEVTLISVTDEGLRGSIEDYQKTMEKARTAPDRETALALGRLGKEIKNENLKRCKALMDRYRSEE